MWTCRKVEHNGLKRLLSSYKNIVCSCLPPCENVDQPQYSPFKEKGIENEGSAGKMVKTWKCYSQEQSTRFAPRYITLKSNG